jgi:hypothetical protein
MTLQSALAKSDCGWPLARGKDRKGREIFAMEKNCGTQATGHYKDFRVVVGSTDPTTKRKLTAAELASTEWHPVMERN